MRRTRKCLSCLGFTGGAYGLSSGRNRAVGDNACMCTHFTATRNEAWVRKTLSTGLPEGFAADVFPGYVAPIARLDAKRQAVITRTVRFGLIPHWAKDATIGRKTYNARSETVAEKPSYRTPWCKRQFAIALLDDFYESSWETGKAVPWRIRRTDGEPMGVASLWDQWVEPQTGEVVESFTMLTVNADGHPVMGRFHRPGDEKRSVVVLEPGQFGDWMAGTMPHCESLIQVPSSRLLVGTGQVMESATRSLF